MKDKLELVQQKIQLTTSAFSGLAGGFPSSPSSPFLRAEPLFQEFAALLERILHMPIHVLAAPSTKVHVRLDLMARHR